MPRVDQYYCYQWLETMTWRTFLRTWSCPFGADRRVHRVVDVAELEAITRALHVARSAHDVRHGRSEELAKSEEKR